MTPQPTPQPWVINDSTPHEAVTAHEKLVAAAQFAYELLVEGMNDPDPDFEPAQDYARACNLLSNALMAAGCHPAAPEPEPERSDELPF